MNFGSDLLDSVKFVQLVHCGAAGASCDGEKAKVGMCYVYLCGSEGNSQSWINPFL